MASQEIVIALLSVGGYSCYARAPRITERISPQTFTASFALIAFVLLWIGMQITSNGVGAIAKAVR
jgi:multiple antibiotic resistance protein